MSGLHYFSELWRHKAQVNGVHVATVAGGAAASSSASSCGNGRSREGEEEEVAMQRRAASNDETLLEHGEQTAREPWRNRSAGSRMGGQGGGDDSARAAANGAGAIGDRASEHYCPGHVGRPSSSTEDVKDGDSRVDVTGGRTPRSLRRGTSREPSFSSREAVAVTESGEDVGYPFASRQPGSGGDRTDANGGGGAGGGGAGDDYAANYSHRLGGVGSLEPSEMSAVETVELASESDDDDDVPEETLAEGSTTRFNAHTHSVLAAAVSTKSAPNE